MARRTTWLILPLLALALGASAQPVPIDLEIGYRWLDLKGDENMYRSQLNEREGFLLRSFTLVSAGDAAFLDHVRIDADDFGSSPAGALRLQAGKTGAYRFNLRYRKADAFSTTLSPHFFDRTRSLVDADLELLRWSRFKPFVGYTWNRYDGPGTTTYHVGQDEFSLLQDLDDTDRELRVGTFFELGSFYGQFTQGWRSFRGRETLTLAPGAEGGNNLAPVLGRPITVDELTREERTNVDTPFTTFYATGLLTTRVRVIGNYSRFAAESDSTGVEDLSGSLVSFPISRFYNGLSEQSAVRAKNDTWRGGAKAEVNIIEGIDFLAGYQREHRELQGSALINTLYLGSVTLGGADPRDLEVILNSSNSLERDEDTINVAIAGRPKGPFAFRAGFSRAKQEIGVTPDLAEIVVGGNGGQGGTFDRQVDTFDLNGTFTHKGFSFGASFRTDSANDPILRTDFVERDRLRLRASWRAPRYFRAGFTAEETKQNNNWPEIAYDGTIRQYGGDVEITPISALSVRASASRYRADSTVLFRRPENFTTDTSLHLEKGKSLEGGLTLTIKRLTFDGNLAQFENEGTFPFELDRSRARVTLQIWPRAGLAAEWARDDYKDALAAGDYEATRYGIFLRLTQ